jgi:hypothetical protein
MEINFDGRFGDLGEGGYFCCYIIVKVVLDCTYFCCLEPGNSGGRLET